MKRLIAFKLVSGVGRKAGHEGKVIILEYSPMEERKLHLDAAKVIKALPNFRSRKLAIAFSNSINACSINFPRMHA